jgi:sugar-specific transcriptional regulator TrmB
MEAGEILKLFGFSEYEIRVYTVLLFNQKAGANEISKETGIPQTKVYQIIKKLADRGFIAILPGHPIRFEVVPPKNAFSSVIEELEDKRKKLMEAIQSLQENYELSKTKEEEVVSFLDWNSFGKKIEELNKKAEKEIDIFSRFKYPKGAWFESLEKTIKRGIKIKVVGVVNDKSKELAAFSYKKIGCEVRKLPITYESTLSFGIFDLSSVNLTIESEKDPTNFICLLLENKGIVRVFKSFFDSMWKEGKPL